uniref:Uncharacterized protein n=1 Tax=Chromera velia CCMP2878 TaxID=1169474 RepID=A0A0G4HP55_9ALVE|eukprot:Cvel_29692.t1-p1 / transcript=Cvel_29692.t1 / gene=Cvel_29692 / organism=Chromera_velia_CCMP2878 / gene_product=hypothetical protein / transcript_product=hypothetical protein / location=Cvel_scaffold4111:5063-11156(+) / protein_length=701 / sequence_SO=supercontig / SO=protein_coding / is_pseudo=false
MRFLWTRRALPRPRLSFAPASLSLQRRHFSVDHYPTELPGKINSEKQFWHLVKSNTMMPNPFKLAAILTYFVEHPRLKEDRRYVEYMQKHRSILQSHLNFSALQASTIVTSLVKALELQCEHGRALHDALLEGLVRQLPTAPVKSLGHLASWLSRSDAGVDRYSGLWRELLGAAARKEGTLDAQTVVQIIDGARVAGVTDGAAYSFLLREILRVTPPLSPLLSGGTEREELLLQGESEGMLNEDAARKRKGAVRKWQRQRETMDVWSPRQCALALSTVCRLPSPTWTSTVSAEDEKALRELQSGAIERVLGKVTDELTSTMKRVKAEMQIRIGIAERQLRQYNYVSIAFSILHANRAGVEVDSEAFTDAAVAFVKEEIALSPSDLIVFLWTLESLGKSDKDLLERGVRRIVRAEAAGGDERGKVMKLSAKHAIYLAELLATVPETETRDLMDLVGRQTLRAMQSKIQPLYRNQLVRLAYATSRLGPREFGRFWNEHDDLRVQILLQATERAAGEKILSSLAELVVSMGRIAGLVPLPDDGGSSVGGRGAGRRLSSSSSPPGPRVTKEGIAQMAQLVLTAAQSRKGGEAASLVTVLERNAGQDGRMRRILSLVWERLGQNSGDAKGGGAERWGKDRELDSALLSAELSEGALQERREWSVDEAPTGDERAEEGGGLTALSQSLDPFVSYRLFSFMTGGCCVF